MSGSRRGAGDAGGEGATQPDASMLVVCVCVCVVGACVCVLQVACRWLTTLLCWTSQYHHHWVAAVAATVVVVAMAVAVAVVAVVAVAVATVAMVDPPLTTGRGRVRGHSYPHCLTVSPAETTCVLACGGSGGSRGSSLRSTGVPRRWQCAW